MESAHRYHSCRHKGSFSSSQMKPFHTTPSCTAWKTALTKQQKSTQFVVCKFNFVSSFFNLRFSFACGEHVRLSDWTRCHLWQYRRRRRRIYISKKWNLDRHFCVFLFRAALLADSTVKIKCSEIVVHSYNENANPTLNCLCSRVLVIDLQ